MKLIARVSRITIADDVWMAGDRILLPDIEVTLGENQRASTCTFSVYDPDLAIGSKYQKMSIEKGGILVPDDLLEDPKKDKPDEGGSAGNETGTLQSSGGGNEQENIKLIIAECQRQGVTNPKQIAYILATAQHESGYRPIDEGGGASQTYAPYFGRGFVQLTHEANYRKYSKILNQDFVKDPDLVKKPTIAAFILVHGMRTGTFTGAKLDDFIKGDSADYIRARTIVNGNDRDALIADYARQWEKKLSTMLPNATLQPATNSPPATTQSGTASGSIAVATPNIETSVKGTEIIVELGFSSTKKLVAFHFIHVSTRTDFGKINKTIFTGQTIRWLLTRVPQTTSYEAVTLKQVSEIMARSYGVNLLMEGLGARYAHLDQTGLTPLQLLQREASKIGYRIVDDKSTLILEPEARPKFSNFILDEETLIEVSFTDKARGSKPTPYQAIADPFTGTNDVKFVMDRKTGQIQQLKNESFVGTPQARDIRTGTAAGATTGSSTGGGTGIVQPAISYGSNPIGFTDNIVGGQFQTDPIKVDKSKTKDDTGNDVDREKTTEVSRKRGDIIETITIVETKKVNNQELKSISKVTTEREVVFGKNDEPIKQRTTIARDVNGQKSNQTTEKTEIDEDLKKSLELKYTPPVDNNNYGLPKQVPGTLDLEDGRAEAQVIADEARRIRGYESTAILMTTEEVLQIVPGEIIGLSSRIFPNPFDREWRVFTVAHNWSAGTTTIVFYTPQGLMEGETTSDSSTPTPSSGATPAGALPVPCWLQTDNKVDPDRTCNTSSQAMVAKFLGAKISSDDEYFQIVSKYGDTTSHEAQTSALNQLGIKSQWRTNLDFKDLDSSLARGKPVSIGIAHRGSEDAPTGGHILVVIGKNPSGDYIVNDPYGSLNDGYKSDPKSGCGAVYKRSSLEKRWKLGGSNSGWGRIFD
jgi:predicted chitinase